MAGTANVFGRPTTPDVASRVLGSASLNANPSPATPANAPAGALSREYATLLYAAYEIQKTDTDPVRLAEIEQVVQIADRALSEIGAVDGAVGTPAPPPPTPPAAPQPPQAVGTAPQAPPPPAVPGGPPAA